MKFLHTGDLHIGKSVNDFSMLVDQKYILDQMIEIASIYKVDAFVIAGDVYDRAVPTSEAVVVLSEFLTRLLECNIKVLMISGNHDSPERLGFGKNILEKQGLYIAGSFEECLKKIKLEDEYGVVEFTLMPFFKPGIVGVKTNNEAVSLVLAKEENKVDESIRNVLITHFFVTNKNVVPEISDSETSIYVGGIDNVESSLFQAFDYVALGHIHKPQEINCNVIYAGSPLAYSFSEVNRIKNIVLVDLKEKEEMSITKIPLTPLRAMRKIKGTLRELMEEVVVDGKEDYIQAILTDKEELMDPMDCIREKYPNTMQIILEKNELNIERNEFVARRNEGKNIVDLFSEFYEFVCEQNLGEIKHKKVVEVVQRMGNNE